MELIQILLATLVTLGLLVTVHEYGHFWVARRCGIKVLRFSIGFGKPLVRWYDKQGTEYAIAAIPLGGYVKMLDEREGNVEESEKDQAFNRKPVGQRIAVVVAGPAANFLFAIFAYWLMFLLGVTAYVPLIGEVNQGSLADQAGLRSGEEIIQIDGSDTQSWQEVSLALLAHMGETGTINLATRNEQGETRDYQVQLSAWLQGEEAPDPLSSIGIEPWRPAIPAVLASIVEGSAAERAGLQSQDRVLAVNGEAINDWMELVNLIQANPGQSLQLTVQRDGRDVDLSLTPASRETDSGEWVGYMGAAVQPVQMPDDKLRIMTYSPLAALGQGLEKTWQMTTFTLDALKKMVVGLISIKNLSGPITIAKVAGASVEGGLESFLSFLAYLSVSLGLINILPIPVLDGGHLMYYLVEWVRGKPVSERIQQMGLRLGLGIIMTLMVLALYNDLMRL